MLCFCVDFFCNFSIRLDGVAKGPKISGRNASLTWNAYLCCFNTLFINCTVNLPSQTATLTHTLCCYPVFCYSRWKGNTHTHTHIICEHMIRSLNNVSSNITAGPHKRAKGFQPKTPQMMFPAEAQHHYIVILSYSQCLYFTPFQTYSIFSTGTTLSQGNGPTMKSISKWRPRYAQTKKQNNKGNLRYGNFLVTHSSQLNVCLFPASPSDAVP